MIDNASIESLKSSIDIVDVIGSFIELRKAGANYKANCPFHGEKTPSFVISPSKQIYHCFGCGVGGDSIKFVMELEKLSYPEAIEKIASMHNFALTYTKGKTDHFDSKRLLEAIGQWYSQNLDQNQTAKGYLGSRGISGSSIEKFGIGYVPSSLEVMTFLQQQMFALPKAVEAGVIAQSENAKGYYARLVERITFPIYSPSGSIVGFGGRTITNHPAKYINSPQTKLFNKSRLLYGYHLAKQSIYKSQKIIICEGYLDVVMFHQAGFTQAVAGMGTALTTEHLPLLRKGEPKIILAYDGDKAGANAARKASQMLSLAGFNGGVVLFPDGQDPADLIAHGESQKVANLLRHPKPLIDYVLESIVLGFDLNDPHAKERAFTEIKSYLGGLSPIIKDAYIPVASRLLGVASSFFGKSSTLPKIANPQSQGADDVAYLSILKTILEEPISIDMVLSVMNRGMFGKYEALFSLLLENKTSHPSLVGLSLDENYKVMEQKQLLDTLLPIVTRYYKDKLKTIPKDPTLDSNKKRFLVKKIKLDILPKLQKGELVSCDILE